MYRGFIIEETLSFSGKNYYKLGSDVLRKYENDVTDSLISYIIGNDGILDGSAIQNNWFPQVDCDIFISHSHKDEDLAIALAGWLWDNFKLKPFVDSCIWGYADVLLKEIDDIYCFNADRKTYNYNQRNCSTSHVHMMLNMALMQMIDKTECLFFLNTPNSIRLNDIETCTLSPWIYSEIGISQMIEKNPPKRYNRKTFSGIEKANISDSLKFKYNLDLSHLERINAVIFNQWAKSKFQGERALDVLYEIIPAPQL